MAEQTIDAMLSPLDRASFLSTYWNTSFLHLPGHAGKFQTLVSWNDLNLILERHRLEPPRLRLVQAGKAVEPSRYLSGGTAAHRLNAGALCACLSQGATLVLDECDELAPAVQELADACAETLQSRVTVNLYGSWRTQHGFDVHWDTQDTIILQVSGRKHWKVFRPTRPHPLEPDIREAAKPSDADLVWEGVLNNGDLLYLPRGWWHVATPLDEPSLHLTVTIIPPRGIEFLHWLADQARDDESVRMDVPRLAPQDARDAFAARLGRALTEGAGADALSRFLEEWDARRRARPRLRLPDVHARSRELTAATRFRLAQAHSVAVARMNSGETVQLLAGEHVWACAVPLVPALRKLSGARPVTLLELSDAVPADAARPLRAMLTALLMAGVLEQS
jgi:ribosomal protein L16 Arg81 hydroxylase